MKIHVALIIITGLLLLNNITAAQTTRNHSLRNRDVGPIVSPKVFEQMVNDMMGKMKHGKQLEINDLIKIVRIDNTIGMSSTIEASEIYNEFDTLFISKFLKISIKKSHAKLDNGMSFYSSRYNLYWGGMPHYNSMYRIIKRTP